MTGHRSMCLVLALAATLAGYAYAHSNACKIRMLTEAGSVCGLQRYADDNFAYASFRGVPYAKAPTKERRFKELEPLDAGSWDNLNATNEGPICYQTDVFYGKIMTPRGMSEDCIYANIHVPLYALPKTEWTRPSILVPPRKTADDSVKVPPSGGLPILVFIHGGGFAFGSGDTDLHGPEHLVSKNVIVITFNYRLNVFGFLSLNSKQVPGNAGLRDMVTLLKWVRRNARYFGGDPDNVTLGGQSAGAISAHLLTLSKAAEGLFKRAILMSGTALNPFFSPTPVFAQYIREQLLALLQINATDPEEIYQRLINVPAEKLFEANQVLIEQYGLTTFVVTLETAFDGVTTIMDDYPENLLAKGRGKTVPLLIGNTNSECETFRNRFEQIDVVEKSKDQSAMIIPPKYLFSIPPTAHIDVAKKFDRRYYHGTVTLDAFLQACTEAYFEYPVLKFVEEYGKINAAPIYVYKFSYQNDSNVLRQIGGLKYNGAAHVEDLTYVFKTNSAVQLHHSDPFKNDDDSMKNFMTKFFVNFMTCSKPICDVNDPIWPAARGNQFLYEDIHTPNVYQVKGISTKQREIIKFYDSLANAE